MITHTKENNFESQETLSINKISFEGQNLKLYNLLTSGIKLTFSDAFINYGITDIRRRAKDLTDIHNIRVSKEFISGTRNKIWYMCKEDLELNSKFVSCQHKETSPYNKNFNPNFKECNNCGTILKEALKTVKTF